MTRKLPPFAKLPTRWIEQGGLKEFRWAAAGSDHCSALMVLMAIAHHIDLEAGIAHITYDRLADVTSLSRAKVAAGLAKLEAEAIILRQRHGRSSYELVDYDPKLGYAQLPARGLYHNGVIDGLSEFRLRRRAELDALKLYFTFAARRDRETNMAHITYDQIEDYCGVQRPFIRPALTVLGANGLLHVERLTTAQSQFGVANAYRLTHLNSHMHMGTIGRNSDFGLSGY